MSLLILFVLQIWDILWNNNTNMESLRDKVALVTGGGSGIGEAIAKRFASHGTKVVVTDINKENAEQTAKEIRNAGGEAISLQADVSIAADSRKSVETASKEFGALHFACNNAGIGGEAAPIGEMPPESFDHVIRVNLSGVFYGMHYQIPAMLEAGGGAIVNISSILGQVGFAQSCAYVAAKHGLVGLTKNAALEYSAKGIRTNVVGPGFIKTPLLDDNLNEEQLEMIKQLHPIGRLGESEEVANLVVWLCSDEASFITGSYYAIDGGYLAQ